MQWAPTQSCTRWCMEGFTSKEEEFRTQPMVLGPAWVPSLCTLWAPSWSPGPTAANLMDHKQEAPWLLLWPFLQGHPNLVPTGHHWFLPIITCNLLVTTLCLLVITVTHSSSLVPTGYHWYLLVITGNYWSSLVPTYHHLLPVGHCLVPIGHHWYLLVIIGTYWSSLVTTGHHWHLMVIIW